MEQGAILSSFVQNGRHLRQYKFCRYLLTLIYYFYFFQHKRQIFVERCRIWELFKITWPTWVQCVVAYALTARPHLRQAYIVKKNDLCCIFCPFNNSSDIIDTQSENTSHAVSVRMDHVKLSCGFNYYSTLVSPIDPQHCSHSHFHYRPNV